MTQRSEVRIMTLQTADEESQVTKSTSGRTDGYHRKRSILRRSSRHGSKAHQHDNRGQADEQPSGQPQLQAAASVTEHVATDSPDQTTAHGREGDVAGS
ncbi:hypothetical protein MTO96_034308, partial [Rhipicephalus appendiculatus]